MSLMVLKSNGKIALKKQNLVGRPVDNVGHKYEYEGFGFVKGTLS